MDYKTDGAFEKAWYKTCPEHNAHHLFFRECPQCVLKRKFQPARDILDECEKILNATDNPAVIEEVNKIVESTKLIIKQS